MTITWDEEDDTAPQAVIQQERRTPVDIESLDDGRCISSSWLVKKPAKPTYENHFGPGGFNRCIGRVDHPNPTHKDEWGNVFVRDAEGHFRKLRIEPIA